ncbi:hypothetical protein E2C01_066141 [Portunus trituberculatus]|uniref:Uncharacterized protein n=1 Tax=Portunus trituberculatus TaxID=210409 RepID=A0A5B7HGB6_PORTR|nr:hypothetical protein [Portunus trituberculatus]
MDRASKNPLSFVPPNVWSSTPPASGVPRYSTYVCCFFSCLRIGGWRLRRISRVWTSLEKYSKSTS